MKEASVVQTIQLETILEDALNLSAKMPAFTATGIHAKIKRTKNSVPFIFKIYKQNNAINGDTINLINKPVKNASCPSRFNPLIFTLAIWAPNIANTIGE